MKNSAIIIHITLIFAMLATYPVSAEENNHSVLSVSIQTDRGYYAPGDIIRISGLVLNEDKKPVNASLLFTFQGMRKTIFSGPEGSFLTTIPNSLAEPENLYKLIVNTWAPGYQVDNLTIPIIIMSEPSSLASGPGISE